MDVRTVLLLALAALVLLAVAARAFSTPLKVLLKVGLNTLLGLAALLLVNATTAFTGLHLGVNLFNGLVVGVLGIPGLVLLLLVQWVVT
ncbi:MAG: Pro-sigmaK processing inhibitor BofA [Oscillospiraceae bacterium]|jgi:inhibitor of the pro-sigma K processing machinery|nr:Pro-sigmaK processing inhibitor BofA [Oscillospiraceae bacterium]